MARVFGAPGKFTSPTTPNQEEFRLEKVVGARINLGMVTMIDPENIPPEALQYLKNARIRFDRTSRRSGSNLFTPTPADSEPILKVALIKLKDGSLYTIRLTPTTAYVLVGPNWVPLTYSTIPGGNVKDRFNIVDVLDKIILANNGVNPIQAIDFNTNTIARLGNAPAYRNITGFFNRAVGFALRDTNETLVGWSADGDATQWDQTIDETAGSTPLLDTPNDLSDFIKNGLSFSNLMIILREKSIWLANKTPVPQNPFYFYAAIPGIGCDCANSAQIIGGGVAWVDTRTGTVYAYAPGSDPSPIGRPIERDLIKSISNPAKVFSAYSPRESEYTVYIPLDDNVTAGAWTFNFKSKAWSYNEYLNLTAADDPDATASGIRVEDLIGTVADLVGTVDELSPVDNTPIRLYGFNDGTIGLENVDANTDCGVNYDTILISPIARLAEYDTNFAKIVIEYQASDANPITIEYSKSGGVENDWILGKTIIPSVFGKQMLLVFRRVIKCRTLAWRITTRTAKFSIRSYEVHKYQSGESKGS